MAVSLDPSPGVATPNALSASPRATIERFVRLMERQDLAGVVALYEPGARWEVHTPGWDGVVGDPAELRELHEAFFGRDGFRVDRCQLVAEDDTVALRWDLSWRDREDGAPCVSFQSHVFAVAGGQIRRHWMYCTGVRVVD